MKIRKPWFIIGIVAFFIIALSAWYVFYKPVRNILQEKALVIKAEEIYNAFLRDEKKANTIYLDKAIMVSGKISEIKTNQQGQQVIILETRDPIFGVVCTMTKPAFITRGTNANIKGFCTGFTNDVILRDCVFIVL